MQSPSRRVLLISVVSVNGRVLETHAGMTVELVVKSFGAMR